MDPTSPLDPSLGSDWYIYSHDPDPAYISSHLSPHVSHSSPSSKKTMMGMNPHPKPQSGQAGPSAPRARRLNSRVQSIPKEKRTPPKKGRLPAKEKTPLLATPDGNTPKKMSSFHSTDTLLFGAFLLFGTFVPMQFGVVVTAANE